MMKTLKKVLAAAALLAGGAFSAHAQYTYTGYFAEGYDYRYQMNPAFANENGFLSMPALGNLNLNIDGNLGLDQVLYNVDGKTVLFTNPGVSTSEAMKHIGDVNKFNVDLRETILAFGFRGFKGYNTVTVSAVAGAHASVPGAFFSLAKEGLRNKTYDISNLRLQGHAYGEIALNHSHDLSKIVPGLRIGASLKFLIGVGNVDAYLHTADLQLGTDNWIARTDAEVYASVKGMEFEHEYSKTLGRDYVSGAKIDSFGIQGFGMALDLGAAYKRGDWEFSAALLDLGFINYPETHLATTNGLQTVETDAFIFNVYNDDEVDRFKDSFFNLYQLEDKGDVGGRARWLAATMNLGAQYELPVYRKLHFGLMNTTRFYGLFTNTEFRLSANVQPVKCFTADASFAVGTYGASFGWLINLHHKGFNFFLGMDRVLGKLSKQGVPMQSHAALNFGLNFPL